MFVYILTSKDTKHNRFWSNSEAAGYTERKIGSFKLTLSFHNAYLSIS